MNGLLLQEEPQILLDDSSGRLDFIPHFLAPGLIGTLDQDIRWRQDQISLFGRTTPLPRLTAWYGNPEAVYYYSGIRNDPLPWTPLLNQIRSQAENLTATQFNSVLANRYADGLQYMSWHADNEAALGPEPIIASISVGTPRRFLFKHKVDGRKLEIILGDGSLLVMSGRLQQEWLHALPKTRKPLDLRINLTFRCLKSAVTKAVFGRDNS